MTNPIDKIACATTARDGVEAENVLEMSDEEFLSRVLVQLKYHDHLVPRSCYDTYCGLSLRPTCPHFKIQERS